MIFHVLAVSYYIVALFSVIIILGGILPYQIIMVTTDATSGGISWWYLIGFVFWDSMALLQLFTNVGIVRDNLIGKKDETSSFFASSFLTYYLFAILNTVFTISMGVLTGFLISQRRATVFSDAVKGLGYAAIALYGALFAIMLAISTISCIIAHATGRVVTMPKEYKMEGR